ncbi:MAG: iron uptake porin [Spirulina sp. SIO3F2]|nr:iron uptake porin [Spirulina sp. SIO3F2]
MRFKNKALQIAMAVLTTLGLSATAAMGQSLNKVETLLDQIESYESYPSEFTVDPQGKGIVFPRDAVSATGQALSEVDELLGQIEGYRFQPNREQDFGQAVEGAAQVNGVFRSDWVYQTFDDLVRRYDCLKDTSNTPFPGKQVLSRSEFATGLNTCVQQIKQQLTEKPTKLDAHEDLAIIQRLMANFETELVALNRRVSALNVLDTLESPVFSLGDNNFSTTQLTEGITSATSLFDQALTNNQESILGDLPLNNSFSSGGSLITRSATFNPDNLDLNNNLGSDFTAPSHTIGELIGADQTPATNQLFDLAPTALDTSGLANDFPHNSLLGGQGGVNDRLWSDGVSNLNPDIENASSGISELSAVTPENVLYRAESQTSHRSGLGLSYNFGPIKLSVGNPSDRAANDVLQELSSGNNAISGQLNAKLLAGITLNATYTQSYHSSGGSLLNLGSGLDGVGAGLANVQGLGQSSNSYGAEFAWPISQRISFSGFFTHTDGGTAVTSLDDSELWTYGLGFALSDLGGKGNVLGLFASVQPDLSIADTSLGDFSTDESPYHFELFYKYQPNDRLTITPSFIVLTAPSQADQDAVVGMVRMTFTF